MFFSALLLNVKRFMLQVKQVSGSMRWTSIAWLFMFYGLTVFVERTHIIQSVEELDSSALSQIIMFGIAIIILLVLLMRGSGVIIGGILKMPVLMMFIYGFFATISAIYSPLFTLSIYKSCLVFMDVLLVLVALYYIPRSNLQNKNILLDLSYFLLSLMIVGAAVGGILEPERAKHPISGVFGYQLYGLWPILNPNELGFICAITGIVGLRRLFEQISWIEKYYWLSVVFISVSILIVSQARTSIVSFVLAVMILSVLIQKLRFIGISAAAMIIIAILYASVTNKSMRWVKNTQEYAERGLSEKKNETLTGRTDLWEKGMAMFYDSPVYGYGYDAGVRYSGVTYGIARGSHMHNSHLQVLVNNGIVGYIPWIIMVSWVTWRAVRRLLDFRWPLFQANSRLYAETFAVLIVILVRTITAQVLVTHQYSFLVFIGILIYLIMDQYKTDNKYLMRQFNDGI